MPVKAPIGWRHPTRTNARHSDWRRMYAEPSLVSFEDMFVLAPCGTCWGSGRIYERVPDGIARYHCAHCDGTGKRLVAV